MNDVTATELRRIAEHLSPIDAALVNGAADELVRLRDELASTKAVIVSTYRLLRHEAELGDPFKRMAG